MRLTRNTLTVAAIVCAGLCVLALAGAAATGASAALLVGLCKTDAVVAAALAAAALGYWLWRRARPKKEIRS